MDLISTLIDVPLDFTIDFVVPFLVVLTILVFVHEWGHFFVARRCGVRVEVFSVGFGREVWGWTDKHGTRWKISLLPLGGYVKMYGDEDPSSTSIDPEKRKSMKKADQKYAFYNKSVGQRAAIVFAGPAINFIFAIILLMGLYATFGKPYTPPVVAGVVEGSAAEVAGLEPDDIIQTINGQKIERFQDIQQMVALNLDQEMAVTILRGGAQIDMAVTPEKIVSEDRFGFIHSTGRIGIAAVEGVDVKPYGPVDAFVAASKETYRITVGTLEAVWQMVVGVRGAEELGGVIRIGAMAGQFAELGFASIITFTALLSINLGLINLFPIPMLDGGHLAFYAAEVVRGKPLSERAQEYFFRFGFACVITLMLYATWNDLIQLNVFSNIMALFS